MSSHLPRRAAFAAASVTALLAVGCSSSSGPSGDEPVAAPDGVRVNTGLLAFAPETVHIQAGQTVTWVGGDNIRHVLVQGTYKVGGDGLRSAENDDKTFHLDLSRRGQTVSHTYRAAGTFTYFCSIHKGMNGVVVVS